MSTFECTLEEFKKVTGEFAVASKQATREELEAGLKCVQLHYLGITPCPEPGSLQETMAVQVLEYAGSVGFKRELDLIKADLDVNTNSHP